MVALSRHRRILLAPALLALVVPALVSCSSDSNGTSAGASAVATPTGSPFTFEITGPATARPGETVPVKLTNTGRLPDGYLLLPDPSGGGTIDQPQLRLGPQESGTVGVTVLQVPLIIRVQSISSGGADNDVYLSIGAVQ